MGIWDWGLGPIPNPQYPIPNPHDKKKKLLDIYNNLYNYFNLYIILVSKKKWAVQLPQAKM